MPANPRAKLVQTKLYIFDLDGTLIDSSIDIANAVNTSLSELGLPTLAVEKIKTFVGTGTRLLMQQALEGRDEIFPHAFKLFSKHSG